MTKATAAKTFERIDHIKRMILEGSPSTVCVQYALQHWGLSRSKSYRIIKRAWSQIHDDVKGSDLQRKALLALMTPAVSIKRQRGPDAICSDQVDALDDGFKYEYS